MIEKISTPDTNVLIRAILKDAIGYMETIGPEDLPCNEQQERCLGIISKNFGAKSECDEAREVLRRWEAAVKNSAHPDLEGITLDLGEPIPDNAVTLEFFKAALLLEDADEQTELYRMADYMGAAEEILHESWLNGSK